MGCCQSTSATDSRPAGRQLTVAPSSSEVPVLMEESVEERALTQLKLTFDGMDKDDDGKVSKVELTAALERNQNLGKLIKEAGLDDVYYVLNQLDGDHDHFVSWDEFSKHLKKAAVQEVEWSGNVAAAKLSIQEKVLRQLKELFDSLDTDKDGVVIKDELLAGLDEGKDEQGLMKEDSLGKLVEQAGFNSDWKALDWFDTNRDGRITWDEFEAHLRSVATAEVQENGEIAAAVELEEKMTEQCCWGLC